LKKGQGAQIILNVPLVGEYGNPLKSKTASVKLIKFPAFTRVLGHHKEILRSLTVSIANRKRRFVLVNR
jgi:hypothetical protein